MISTRTRFAAALAVAATSMATLGAVAPAQAAETNPADPTFTPSSTDLVGVGSDTSQLALHYLAEGKDGVAAGYNASRTVKLASWAADGSPSTISLRNGASPITRPNGSGAGKKLLYGSSNDANVDFARSSSAISTTERDAGLKAFPFAVDGLKLGTRKAGTDAPASLTEAQVLAIYKGDVTNWSQVGGKDAVIRPYVPQSGSGTRSFFEAQLVRINDGKPVSLGSNVKETQEHSDEKIKDDPDAVVPFSTGRAKSTTSIGLLNGFSVRRALYNVVRGNDLTGSKAADLNAAFGETGFVCSDAARPLIEAAGFDQLARTAQGGVCGQTTTSATTNFLTAGGQQSTVALTGKATPSGKITLKAAVGPSTATGTVTFTEGDATVGTATVDTLGNATLALQGVAKGAHSYTATFAPDDPQAYSKAAGSVTVTVPDAKYSKAIEVTAPTSAYGAARTVTVNVGTSDLKATGSVTFVYGDAAEQTADLQDGAATFTVPASLDAGTYWGAVSYSGDSDFAEGYKLVKFVVTKATTRTSVKLAAAKVKVRKATKATVTVGITGSALKASGTVTLKIGSSVVGTGKVVNGQAVVTLKAQSTTGAKRVVATFAPSSSNYGGSTSATATYTVVK